MHMINLSKFKKKEKKPQTNLDIFSIEYKHRILPGHAGRNYDLNNVVRTSYYLHAAAHFVRYITLKQVGTLCYFGSLFHDVGPKIRRKAQNSQTCRSNWWQKTKSTNVRSTTDVLWQRLARKRRLYTKEMFFRVI